MKKQRLLFIFFSAVLLLADAPTVGGWSAALASAATVSLPATGQTKCYNSSGTEIACAGTGQDGDKKTGVAWPNTRFTVSGECVTDNLTGLLWTKNANLPGATKTWQAALDYVAALNASGGLCGYTDWRLPQILELESLVHAGYNSETCGASACSANSAWLNTQGFTNAQSVYYWSSSTSSSVTGYAWYIPMSSGYVSDYGKAYSLYVWPVRGGQNAAPAEVWETGQTKCYNTSGTEIPCTDTGQDGDKRTGVAWPSPRFTDNSNGTITDNLTGLIWLKNAICFGSKTWQDALTASNNLANNQCGLSDGSQAGDWRLPNRKELLSLVDFSKYAPALPAGHPFTNAQSSLYWSSSTNTGYTSDVWIVNMTYGYVDYYYRMFSLFVWPVRGSGALGTVVLSSTSLTFTSTTGSASITVTDSSGATAWTATSSLSWATITSGSSGTGNGTVVISVSANTTGATRTGNITIAGQTVTITQNATKPVLLVTTTQTSYDTIQAAYDANTAASGSSILVQGTTLTEALVFNQNNSITLTGGYDSSFITVGATMTTVQGSLTISGGKVIVANIVIQ